ncbi:uncharacterized protein HMPREF1541_00551 [Cyphellophora europaea CBS 101466]|uniref:Cytochrome P450 n=1 Tax=Cyphellophora europaea (strain CBS 101466) TaxID=1220924 RepID=W2SCG0_CYPE1|nr:uncharacterized protein HMPREF1541_00551 [Cyphellophora europaea CBS 101466]ETN46367.1 hypothetical protein HMPREF1541_00551 [Cyphellophora europaea CBS 101466]
MSTLLLPSLPFLVLFALLLYPVVLLSRIIYNISPLHPLSNYPGPLLWRASRLPWTIALQRGTLHLDLLRFHARHGRTVRIAPNELSYTSPAAWRDIYLPNPSPGNPAFQRTDQFFKKIRSTDPFSIMGHDESAHARFRRAFMPAFTDRALAAQLPLLEANVSNLIAQLHNRIDVADTPVDLVAWLNYLTFDVSGLMSFGETFECVDTGAAHPWVAINLNFGRGAAMMAGLNMLGLSDNPLVAKLLPLLLPKAVREKMAYHRELAAEKVRDRVAAGKHAPRADFMDALLRNNEAIVAEGGKRAAQALSLAEIEINMMIMVFAGSETVASSLVGILTALLQNPPALERLQKELRSAFHREDEITARSVQKLEFLTAVISEGLRVHPPVPYSVPRVVPKGGAEVCGKMVPEGTLVAIHHLPAYHDAANFDAPHKFIPERWLRPSSPGSKASTGDTTTAAAEAGAATAATTAAEGGAAIFEPFLVGRHHCIGSKFAWVEMRLVLARLLYAFDMTPTCPMGDFDFVEQDTHIFWEKNPLLVSLRARS